MNEGNYGSTFNPQRERRGEKWSSSGQTHALHNGYMVHVFVKRNLTMYVADQISDKFYYIGRYSYLGSQNLISNDHISNMQ